MIQVGQKAPDFKLEGVLGTETKEYSLEDMRGKWTVLFFYPLDFTFVCPTEILEFSKNKEGFEKLNARVFGASTDSVFSHQAWLKELGELTYPLLSDNNHRVSRQYGILVEEDGVALRGTFIIDPEGVLRYQLVHDLSVGRNVQEVLRVLAALQTGELCGINWEPGQETLGDA